MSGLKCHAEDAASGGSLLDDYLSAAGVDASSLSSDRGAADTTGLDPHQLPAGPDTGMEAGDANQEEPLTEAVDLAAATCRSRRWTTIRRITASSPLMPARSGPVCRPPGTARTVRGRGAPVRPSTP